ncbi:hypothetical protein [Flavisphingomonas formosensis]|uniref:hypothetical protein n=1 Tax=Flavisphingomonas formosensis TaxID=861534 RepID=UPI0012F922DF|nr:hypothetical protein [Sphingomonas formosensis]
MRFNRKAMLAVAASLAVGTAAVAATKAEPSHVMEVALPDGSVAHIRYSGDVAPRILFAPAGADAFAPTAFDAFDAAPFAMFDRIAAEMDAQADAMFRQIDAMRQQAATQPGGLTAVSTGTLPAGAVSYSFVSTSSGKGMCSRSVQVTSLGEGKQPKVVSQTSGDCGPAASQTPAPATDATAKPSIPAIRT